MLSRLVTLGVSAISLPLNVRYLGKEEYGIWITISGTVVMLNLLDLGIASTLTNVLSKAYAEDNREEAIHAYSTAFWLTAVVACLLGFCVAACLPFVNWASLFHLTDPSMAIQAKRCVIIAVAACLINLPLSLSNKVGAAYRELHLMNYAAMAGALLSLLAIVGGILLHFSLSNLMLAYCTSTVISNICINVWLWAFRRPWLKPGPRRVRGSMARGLFAQGSLFFILQLCGVVVFNSDNLVITHYLGPAEVTPYSVAWRLVSYAALLQQLLIPAAWPVFSEAYQSGDIAWVRSTYHSLVKKSLGAVALVGIGIGLFGRPLVRVWAGGAAVPSSTLLWVMAFWAVLVSATTNQALLLSAVGRLKLEALVAVLAAVANLALSIFLVQRIGSLGVILATICSFLVLMLGPQQWEVRRVLQGRYLPRAAIPVSVAD